MVHELTGLKLKQHCMLCIMHAWLRQQYMHAALHTVSFSVCLVLSFWVSICRSEG